LTEAEVWRRKHGAQFEKTKYVLIHFTRNPKINTDVAIRVEGTSIPPSKEGIYLGVIFDQQLRFCSHINQAVKKGTQFGLAIGSIARAKWGAPIHYLRRLVTAVAAPRMDYVAVIWHRPEDMRSRTILQQTKFSTVQRLESFSPPDGFFTLLEYDVPLDSPAIDIPLRIDANLNDMGEFEVRLAPRGKISMRFVWRFHLMGRCG
jgi:hypothetical protein